MTPALRATYRLQFHRGFTFADAEALVPYLVDLGISHLYASPITMAVPGSTHGYDVADPTRINPELGGEEGFERLARRLGEHGMGVLLDIVPNHMAASGHNPFWLDMLEHGPASPSARLFDVAWDKGQLLLPVLGDPLRASIEAGTLTLRADPPAERIWLVYADHRFPLRPESVAHLCAAAGVQELAGLDGDARTRLDDVLAKADIASLVDSQHWRLAWWRTAAHDLNYRRFFNITDLAGVRIEEPEAFELIHRLPLDLLRRGLIHGLRIDHIDGLADPAGYCARLRAAVGPDIPLLVEKILEPREALRDWPIDGTTGYERLNDINGLFLDAEAYGAFEEDLRSRHLLTGTPAARLAAAKRQVLDTSLNAEVDALTALARDGLDADIRAGDLTEPAIRQAVVALIVHCPVYRSYALASTHDARDEAIWQAIGDAIGASEDPLTQAAAGVLLDRLRQPRLDSDRAFRLRFQQLSGPAMAKGFEDTELYRYPVLLSVNEVGGSVQHPACTIEDIHAVNVARGATRAADLIPLATHDTKRGPGTRARLTSLSFQPERWLRFLDDTREPCAELAQRHEGAMQPDALDQLMILQMLVSAWPINEERVAAGLTKALREAKRHTNWETPDEGYEAASLAFAAAILNGAEAAPLRDEIGHLLAALAPAERVVGLCQIVLQHTLPGTPDIYQGTEFPDYSLMDPDNRRPVDWAARRAAVAGSGEVGTGDRETFDLIRALLGLRRREPALVEGGYAPLSLPASPWRWFGFERGAGDSLVRVVVPTRVPPEARTNAPPFPVEAREPGLWHDLPVGRRDATDPPRPFLILTRARR
ncbi:malto-oligosyltrehalose synthase [Starkeya koreensis]|uniref:Malto-oligosyltrehalose synthase n=1 Tax=Ancylobacter koreensis TaxID=266121 RepID=A0ABT0DRT0_9HYPH|nr:malto-oligosyltrehalose synthase [Ancylobacter koreensis]MCK0209904.1 malto-oligosyltrehalose synthase [Ancylobacter koreensis]